jgi:hypothetical protein
MRLLLVFILALAVTALGSPVAAEELPPEEAARCAHLQRQLEGLEDRLDNYEDRVAREHRLIEEQGALLQGMKEKLEPSDREGVSAYNAMVGQYGETITRYNAELLPELAHRRDAFNAKARQYNKDCAGKEVR